MRIMRILFSVTLFSFLLYPQRTVPAQSASARQPNIILILTDDLEIYPETLATMPSLQQLLIAEGMTFSSAIVTMPSCCPSRASVLTGKYVHNHGVIANMPPNGGYPRFLEHGEEALTIGTMLAGAGYRTVLVGKYLNHYPLDTAPTHVPPGWTEWYAYTSGGLYLTYLLNENGILVKYPKLPENYSTDIYRNLAVDFIQRNARDHADQPFFMMITPYAPHYPVDPAPRHATLFGNVKAPRTAAHDEFDVSDKPRWVAKLEPLTQEQERFIDDFYRDRLRAMQAVDEMIAAIYQALVATGQLGETYIIFTSDNGMHLGEHRIVYGKGTAYDVAIRVPFIVRGPGVPAHSQQAAVISLVDLAPTFGSIAGLRELPASFDGRSMLPLLTGELTTNNQAATSWRAAVLFDNPDRRGSAADGTAVTATVTVTGSTPAASVGLVKIDQSDALWEDDIYANPYFDDEYPVVIGKDGIPRMDIGEPTGKPETSGGMANFGFRTATYKYVEYKNGDRELYDLVNDPLELENQAVNASPALLTTLSAHLATLHDCAGEACRIADMAIPRTVFPLTDDWMPPTATVVPTTTVLPTSTDVATNVPTPIATPTPTATSVNVEGNGATPTPVFRQFLPFIGGH